MTIERDDTTRAIPVGIANPHGISLEPEAQAFVEAGEFIPYLYTVTPDQKRRMLDELQARPTPRPAADEDWYVVNAHSGEHPPVPVRVVRPTRHRGSAPAPVVLWVHGGGWVMGNAASHDRLVREVADASGATIVFPEYGLSPEHAYPTAIDQCATVARWIVDEGHTHGLDASRIAVVGDQMGGTIAAALTLRAAAGSLAVQFAFQAFMYPATDAACDTASFTEFATGYSLRAEGYRDFWRLYCPNPARRFDHEASPARAPAALLAQTPPALIITAEADCLRDEGEAYAAALRDAGVPALAVRYSGVTNSFMMLDTLRGTMAAEAAIGQLGATLRAAFGDR
ncbi:alpha/beta hydrolase [Microbacterium sp.]|uniref:alpha/beta hydrolase n=1 Tax=Microbacterium sp. TaxID=51671 RepID=UPI003C78DB4E